MLSGYMYPLSPRKVSFHGKPFTSIEADQLLNDLQNIEAYKLEYCLLDATTDFVEFANSDNRDADLLSLELGKILLALQNYESTNRNKSTGAFDYCANYIRAQMNTLCETGAYFYTFYNQYDTSLKSFLSGDVKRLQIPSPTKR